MADSAFSAESAFATRSFARTPTAGLGATSPFGQSRINLQKRLPGLVRIADFVGVAGLGFVIDTPFAWHDVRPLTHSLGIAWAAVALLNCLQVLDAYALSSLPKRSSQILKASFSWACAFMSLLILSYFTDRSQEFVAPWAWMWFAAGWAYLIVVRAAVTKRLRRWQREGRLVRNIAVLGTGEAALELAHRLRHNADEANVVGVFVEGGPGLRPGSSEIAGDSNTVAGMAACGQVDEIVLALPWVSGLPLNQVISKFSAFQVEVRIEPGLPPTDYPPQDFTSVAGVPLLTIQRRPLSGWGAPLKRAEDLVLVAALLLLVAPFFLVIAIAVKLDSRGPVFFRQGRYGFNNNRITVLKFRSMHHDDAPDPSVPQARPNDPRVTRVGAVLRRTSLDELPQLLNVLRGDMSLVGPRPHADAHNQKYAQLIDGYLGRHRMKPGITGWAQVNGLRGETETTIQMRRRLECDLSYIANWSLLLDIKILLMTVPVVVRGTNAY